MKTQHTNNTFGTPNTRANPSVAKKVISATPPTRTKNFAILIKFSATNRKNNNLITTLKIRYKYPESINNQIKTFEESVQEFTRFEKRTRILVLF